MANFNLADILTQLKTGVLGLAKASLSDFITEAKTDGETFIDSLKDKIPEWTKMLINGDITAEDLELLIEAEKDLAVMTALKQAGLAEIRIDQFRNSVVNLLTNTIVGLVK